MPSAGHFFRQQIATTVQLQTRLTFSLLDLASPNLVGGGLGRVSTPHPSPKAQVLTVTFRPISIEPLDRSTPFHLSTLDLDEIYNFALLTIFAQMGCSRDNRRLVENLVFCQSPEKEVFRG